MVPRPVLPCPERFLTPVGLKWHLLAHPGSCLPNQTNEKGKNVSGCNSSGRLSLGAETCRRVNPLSCALFPRLPHLGARSRSRS